MRVHTIPIDDDALHELYAAVEKYQAQCTALADESQLKLNQITSEFKAVEARVMPHLAAVAGLEPGYIQSGRHNVKLELRFVKSGFAAFVEAPLNPSHQALVDAVDAAGGKPTPEDPTIN